MKLLSRSVSLVVILMCLHGVVAAQDMNSITGSSLMTASGPGAPPAGMEFAPVPAPAGTSGDITVSVDLMDNLDLRRGQIRQLFFGTFEVPLTDWTHISDFGPPLVTSFALTQTWPFVRAVYRTMNAAGEFNTTPDPTDGVRVRVEDMARNVGITTQPFAAGTVPPSTGFPAELQRLRVAEPASGTAVCGGLSGNCAAGTPNTLTIQVDATVTEGSPFQRMILIRRDAQGVDQLLAFMSFHSVRTEAGQTVWRWTHEFEPAAEGGLPPQANSAMWALGINAEGDGFFTNSSGSFILVAIQ